jgi:hypothetical protein
MKHTISMEIQLLSTCSRVLVGKLIVAYMVKRLPAFMETRYSLLLHKTAPLHSVQKQMNPGFSLISGLT